MRFFVEQVEGKRAYLSSEESQHLVKVLRKKEGARLELVDGKGRLYQGQLLELHKKACVVQIESEETFDSRERRALLHVFSLSSISVAYKK